MCARKRSLSVENLEARALFAGTGQIADVYENVTSIGPAFEVVDGNPGFQLQILRSLDLDTQTIKRTLVLDGTNGTGTLTIDVEKLTALARLAKDPFELASSSIVVKNFDTVIFDGANKLQNLTISDVRSLHAPQINITGKFESDRVAEIELKSIDGSNATVKGDHVKLQVGDFGDFTEVHLNLKFAVIDTLSTDLGLDVFKDGTIIVLPNVPQTLKAHGLGNQSIATNDAAVFVSPGHTGPIKASELPITFVPDDMVSALLDKLAAMRSTADQIDIAAIKRAIGELALPELRRAIDATGDYFSTFNANSNNSTLTLKGNGTGSIVVDFDKLPSYVANLVLENFDSVRFIGTDHLNLLNLKDVRSLVAPEMEVWTQFRAENIESIELKNLYGTAAFIQGDDVKLNIGDVGPSTRIILNLNSVLINTQSNDLSLDLWNAWTVVTLPNIPQFLTGTDQMGSRLRLGSASVTDPGSSGGGQLPVEVPEQPIEFIPDQVVSELLERLDALRNAAEVIDLTVIKRIVSELSTPAPTNQSVDTITVLPGGLLRRDLAPSAPTTDRLGAFEFTSSVQTNTLPTYDVTHGNAQISELPAIASPEKQTVETASAPVETTMPLVQDVEINEPNLHVTVDPEAESLTPKTGLLGMISQLVDRGMNLKSYVLDQLSQEVSPGERSGVLLVDPKASPVRGTSQTRPLT